MKLSNMPTHTAQLQLRKMNQRKKKQKEKSTSGNIYIENNLLMRSTWVIQRCDFVQLLKGFPQLRTFHSTSHPMQWRYNFYHTITLTTYIRSHMHCPFLHPFGIINVLHVDSLLSTPESFNPNKHPYTHTHKTRTLAHKALKATNFILSVHSVLVYDKNHITSLEGKK